jgi:YebC/PmpR family DNA-binding regulatory protein
MAGHSHSANIKFRKDRVDSKRAALFSKLSRMITVAARQGGSVDANAKLRLAVDKAKVVSMSKDAIERAIKKGTGAGDTTDYEELLYEGYGPGGVAVLLEILTDKRSRTAPEIRKLFESHGGNLAANGAVSWMFERRGVFDVDPACGLGEEQLLERVLECGAEDLVRQGDGFTIYCPQAAFAEVRSALDRASVLLRGAGLAYVAAQRVPVTDPALGRRIARLLDALDEHDDVQGVHSNEDFGDEVVRLLGEDR